MSGLAWPSFSMPFLCLLHPTLGARTFKLYFDLLASGMARVCSHRESMYIVQFACLDLIVTQPLIQECASVCWVAVSADSEGNLRKAAAVASSQPKYLSWPTRNSGLTIFCRKCSFLHEKLERVRPL